MWGLLPLKTRSKLRVDYKVWSNFCDHKVGWRAWCTFVFLLIFILSLFCYKFWTHIRVPNAEVINDNIRMKGYSSSTFNLLPFILITYTYRYSENKDLITYSSSICFFLFGGSKVAFYLPTHWAAQSLCYKHSCFYKQLSPKFVGFKFNVSFHLPY
jgi:hypothetical protein